MKLKLLVLSLFLILTCGCSDSGAQGVEFPASAESITDNPSDNMIMGFEKYLGMDYEDVIVKLNHDGITYEEYFTPTNPDDLSIGYNGLFTEDFSIWTSAENREKVCGIVVFRNHATTLGLNVGDPFDSMIELYGDDFVEYTNYDETKTYEYNLNDYYLQITIYNEQVDTLRISENRFDVSE